MKLLFLSLFFLGALSSHASTKVLKQQISELQKDVEFLKRATIHNKNTIDTIKDITDSNNIIIGAQSLSDFKADTMGSVLISCLRSISKSDLKKIDVILFHDDKSKDTLFIRSSNDMVLNVYEGVTATGCYQAITFSTK